MVDVLRYFIEDAGAYEIVLRVKDLNATDHIDSLKTTIDIKQFTNESVEISDIELASEISRAEANASSNFIKNSYHVMPSPGRLFGEGSPNVYYYFEAYNLSKNVPGEHYKVVTLVKDANGNITDAIGTRSRTRKKKYDSTVEMGMLNISELPSGKYTLVYGIADSTDSMLASDDKIFYVYNPAIAQTNVFREGEFGPLNDMSEKELDEEFQLFTYLCTEEDKKFYKNLNNANAKRNFIFSIWSRPREDYAISGLALRQEYLARVQFADKTYHSVYRSGWKSDRGRVFILYGFPSRIERFPSTQESLPYQIWQYDYLKGQAALIFVFADRTGLNKYELLHSTLRGELQDFDWQRLILRGSRERTFR